MRVHRTLLFPTARRRKATRRIATNSGWLETFQGELRQRDRGERESKNLRQLAPAQLCSFGPALTRSVRQERRGEGRPSGLMRRAKTLSGLGVEVLIEEEQISPGWIVSEARIWAVRRPPVIRVEQKQAEQTAPEFCSHLVKIRPLARSGRELGRQVLAEKVVKVPQRFDREEVQGKPNWSRQLELPPKRPECDSPVRSRTGRCDRRNREPRGLPGGSARAISTRKAIESRSRRAYEPGCAGSGTSRRARSDRAGRWREVVEMVFRPQFMLKVPERPFPKHRQSLP